MKSVIICGYNNNDSAFETSSYFYLDGVSIPISIINQEIQPFDSENKHKDCVLVKKSAFSCNFRDRAIILILLTQFQRYTNKDIAYYSPIGSEFVGTVYKIGKNIKNLNIGDRVIPMGQYPYAIHPDVRPGLPTNSASKRIELFHEMQLLKIPDQVPDEIAASFSILGHTVFNMIEKAQIKKEENILITSIRSNTSLALLSALKDLQCNVFGLSSSTGFKDKFLNLGAKEVFLTNKGLYNEEEYNVFRELALKVGGFDIVFDPFADLHLGKVHSLMNINSRYITCGLSNQSRIKEHNYEADYEKIDSKFLNGIIKKNISIIGSCLGNKNHLELGIQKYIEGSFKIQIDKVITGNDIVYFFDRTFNDPTRFGKVIYKYCD